VEGARLAWRGAYMIPIRELCRRRRIRKVDLPTPMLIPSFSSKGFPEIKALASAMMQHITDVAMISSYDIFYGHIGDDLESPNLLFIDSGGYEARHDRDLSELYAYDYQPEGWTREQHEKTLAEINVLSALVLVSFDEVENEVAISDQIELGAALFDRFPEAASDFLVKPYGNAYIDLDKFMTHHSELSRFDVIGITEKELGGTLSERLRVVVQLRRMLMDTGLDIPIHVFGCLDPLSVWLFYLCGADVFDGLSWLRFAFHDSVAIYRNNWAILANYPNLSDSEIRMMSYLENLRILERMKERMTAYADCYDGQVFGVDLELIESVLKAAGVTIS
jgi:hypothetical protein